MGKEKPKNRTVLNRYRFPDRSARPTSSYVFAKFEADMFTFATISTSTTALNERMDRRLVVTYF